MKKIFFSLFLICISSFAFAKKKEVPVDNTFSCLVQNNSDFEITVDGLVLASGKSEIHKFPLHTSALYDGWTVDFSIPITDSVHYVHSEKKLVVDNQKILKIENPNRNSAFACYVIVKNQSDDSVKIQNSLRGSILPCFESGIINGRRDLLKPVYSVASHESAVVSLENEDKIFVSNEHTNKNYPLPIQFAKGFVYKYVFDGENCVLHDARPLHLLTEKLWHKDFASAQVPYAMQEVNGKIFVAGSETLLDEKKRKYRSGFIQCFDRSGVEIWKQSYAPKDKDTYLYDMALIDENTIAVAGRIVHDESVGTFLCYDLDGRPKKAIAMLDSVRLGKIEKSSDGAFVVRGYDTNDELVEYSIAVDFTLGNKKNIAYFPYSRFLQDVNMEIYDDGTVYAAGESAEMEKPTACITKTTQDGKTSVLYMASEPNSYIADMKINRKTEELVFCGSLGGKDSYGNDGKPFIRCVNAKSGKILWENIFQTAKYEIAAKIASCDDYGFVVLMVNANDDGDVCAPCALVRTNAVGKAE